MIIQEVNTTSLKETFLNLVDIIYKSDPNYIRPLDVMIDEIFNPTTNPLFANGEATRFVLFDAAMHPIGRIAAFINRNKAYGYEQPTGGIGFFECINEPSAATRLFDTAKAWLAQRGMQAMDGPINFGENDNFWGLLVDGFTPPGFGMPYNPPYYRQLFEEYGFQPYYEQITSHLNLKKPFPERFWKIAERVISKPELTFRHFTWKEAPRFADDFINIYNDAWQFHENFTPMQPAYLHATLQKARPFLRENFIWYAYWQGEPIGFLVMFPDANQIIRHLNGKMGFLNKLRFLWYRHMQPLTRARVTVLGVKPHYQRMGIESALFRQFKDVVAQHPSLSQLELSWVGDFNPKMRALMEAMEADFGKRHITWRYLFENQKQAHRSPIIPMGKPTNTHR
ncbi:MAG: GNAT family N-acetyltransferase [Marinilabiliaceae bacterium]|nr:GNAT family N-acetyltransferase [Marinilabiliaceae bacterium]